MTTVLYLCDDITPALAKSFKTELRRKSNGGPVTILLNSPGGSVDAGDEIYEAIRSHGSIVIVAVIGIVASAASYLMCAADRIEIAPKAWVMCHNPFVEMLSGDAKRLGRVAVELAEVETRYARVYAKRSGQPEADVRKWMDAERWLDAETALALGFVDAINPRLEVADHVSAKVRECKHPPARVLAMANDRPASRERTKEQRNRLRRRLMIIAQQARAVRDPAREAKVRELGERALRRKEMQAVVDRGAADRARADAEERDRARRRQQADYAYDANNIPRQQRKYV